MSFTHTHTHTHTHKQQKSAPGTLYATVCPIVVGSFLFVPFLSLAISAHVSE